MSLSRCLWFAAALALAAPSPAAAQRATLAGEIDDVLQKLKDAELLERTYGALGATHLARRQWGFAVLSSAELRPWQRALAPGVPDLIDLLAEEGGLEWVDQNGVTQNTTTPRQEATMALLALERASVEPLIAALDRPPLARKADDLLRRITRGGPPGADRASWQAWWAQHQKTPLPNERGHFWLVLLLVLGTAAAGALVVWRVRTAKQVGLADQLRAAAPAPPPAPEVTAGSRDLS